MAHIQRKEILESTQRCNRVDHDPAAAFACQMRTIIKK